MSVRVWLLAVRPKTLLAALAPVAMGVGLATADGAFRLLPALAALIGALLIQIGTNLANDYYDFMRGGDTADRVGPVRVTQAGLVSPAKVKRAMALTFAAATVVGLYLVAVGGWPILVVGTLSLLSGWAYTGGPFPLAYNGLGDVFVWIFFGPVAVAGTYWVQALSLSTGAVVAGVAIGALNTAVLVANNLRDLDTDRAAHKRTLPVRFGRGFGRGQYVAALVLAVTIPVAGVVLLGWAPTTLICLAALVLAWAPLKRVLGEDRAEALRSTLPATARVSGLYGLLFALGVSLGAAG